MDGLNATSKHIGGHEGHHQHIHGRPHVTELVNMEISQLAPYAGLILVISLVIFFLVRYYIFEHFLIPKLYGSIYFNLNSNQKRGFVNHHIAALAKIIMLVSGAYPFFAVVASTATLHTPFGSSKHVTLGDVLTVLNQVFVAMYIFELIYREQLSYVAVLHHIGTVVIASSAIAISLDWQHQRDATLEFILCYVWGVFDVIAEFWPHVAIIQKRRREGEHNYLRKVFMFAGIISLCGTVLETICVMYLWGWAWDRWTLAFRVVTPILHIIFTCAQLWGAWNFYKMWQYEVRMMHEKKTDEEHTSVSEQNVVVEPKVEPKAADEKR